MTNYQISILGAYGFDSRYLSSLFFIKYQKDLGCVCFEFFSGTRILTVQNEIFSKIVGLNLAPGRGVPVASIQKYFGSSGRDWKPWKKLPIPCKFCTYRFSRYSSTCYGKVRINPLMANTRNPDFFACPVANAAWFVVARPWYLNRDLLSGPKGN